MAPVWPWDGEQRRRDRALDDWFRQRGGDLGLPDELLASPATDVMDVLGDRETMQALEHRMAVWHDLSVVSMRLAPVEVRHVGRNEITVAQRWRAFDVVMHEFWPKLPSLLAVLRPTPDAYAISFDTRWWIGAQLPPGCPPDHHIVQNTPSGLDGTNDWFPYARDIITPPVQEQMMYDRGPVQAVLIADGWLAAHCGNNLDPHGMEVALGFLESIALAIDERAIARYQQDREDALEFLARELDDG